MFLRKKIQLLPAAAAAAMRQGQGFPIPQPGLQFAIYPSEWVTKE